MKLTINGNTFNVEIARTDEEKRKGLRGVEELKKDEGMLFIFDEEKEVEFEMDDTLIDLDIIFIDEDKEIISVERGIAGDEDETIIEDNVKYVLEINPGFNFKPGMEVEFDEDEDEDDEEDKEMHVLDSEGNTQAIVKSGTRIFSRKNTKTIVKLSKDAEEKKTDVAYKKLGRKMFQYLDIQESNKPDYVEGKD